MPFSLPHKSIKDQETRENFQAIESALFLPLPEFPNGQGPRPPLSGISLFAQDNGAGKTKLMVQFPTGSAVQVGIEP